MSLGITSRVPRNVHSRMRISEGTLRRDMNDVSELIVW